MRTRRPLLVLSLLFAFACAPTHTSGPPPPPAKCLTVDFSFDLAGTPHRFGELRGTPVVLVLMRTSDLPSQRYIQEVREAFERLPGTTPFLVLTVEPTEAPFVDPYVDFEQLPFPIGVAEPALKVGGTSLGTIDGIPSTYFFDGSGCLVNGAVGGIMADAIVKEVRRIEGE